MGALTAPAVLFPSQALVNLVLTGVAVPNVWDKDKDMGGMGERHTPVLSSLILPFLATGRALLRACRRLVLLPFSVYCAPRFYCVVVLYAHPQTYDGSPPRDSAPQCCRLPDTARGVKVGPLLKSS